MIKGLRAKIVNEKDIKDGCFSLISNTPRLIDRKNNLHTAHIHEGKEKEDCYIRSRFTDESMAIICFEFKLNFFENPKKVDLSYYYLGEDKSSCAYLYDFKKTFAGIDDMIHLVEQWKSSIIDAKYCFEKLEEYNFSVSDDIRLGVITENDDIVRRKYELEQLMHKSIIPDSIPSYIKSQRRADISDSINKSKLLAGFSEGKVTIKGNTYKYDTRMFKNKKHEMIFCDGKLKKQKID